MRVWDIAETIEEKDHQKCLKHDRQQRWTYSLASRHPQGPPWGSTHWQHSFPDFSLYPFFYSSIPQILTDHHVLCPELSCKDKTTNKSLPKRLLVHQRGEIYVHKQKSIIRTITETHSALRVEGNPNLKQLKGLSGGSDARAGFWRMNRSWLGQKNSKCIS